MDDSNHRIFSMSVSSVYPHYKVKLERKNRTQDELDRVITWLTGYSDGALHQELDKDTDFRTFFAKAPNMNPNRKLITGVICGVRVEDIKQPLMQEIRYLDKLVDELAKGKSIEKVLRTN
jgi:hypothetical protein